VLLCVALLRASGRPRTDVRRRRYCPTGRGVKGALPPSPRSRPPYLDPLPRGCGREVQGSTGGDDYGAPTSRRPPRPRRAPSARPPSGSRTLPPSRARRPRSGSRRRAAPPARPRRRPPRRAPARS